MKSNQRKWEELVDDAQLEMRLQSNIKSRLQGERTRNRRVLSTVMILLVSLGSMVFGGVGLFGTDDLGTDVSLVIQEFDSNVFLYIGED